METYIGTKSTTRLGKINAMLAAVFLAVLSTGSAAQTAGPPPTAGGERMSAIPKAVTPITIEITQAGNIVKATDANGKVLPRQDPSPANQAYFTKGQRRYLLGTAMITNPLDRSAKIEATCLGEDKRWNCWPADRSAFVQIDRRRIRNAWYMSNKGEKVRTRPPVGAAPTPTQDREYWFGQLPRATLKQYQSVLPRDLFDCICCCCFGGVCYDGPPCT
jgi:hypothetical protein